MNILFIASTDSYNFALPNLIHRFNKRGHKTKILLTEKNNEHSRMFYNTGLDYEYFSGELINPEQYDVAIYQCLINDGLYNLLEKYGIFQISLFYHNVPLQYVLGEGFANAHITFCFGDSFKENQITNRVYQELVPIGSPQYDDILDLPQSTSANTILFLDQHFYPAGKDGKLQLAKMLLETAKKYNNYRLVVKPRTIPSYIKDAKHKAEHIYDYIRAECEGSLPRNLILLKEHFNLNDLTKQAGIVATTFSTAIYPAILMKKSVVFVKGFTTKDTEFYNKNAVESHYQTWSETGCVINYWDFVEHLPKVAPIPNNLYDRLYYNNGGSASDRILEIIEFIYKKVISQGVVLPVLGLNYTNYRTKIEDYISLYGKTRNYENSQTRLINKIYNRALEEFYLVNIRSGFLLDKGYQELYLKLENSRDQAIECLTAAPNDQIVERFAINCQELFSSHIRQVVERLVRNNRNLPVGFKGWFINYLYNNGEYDRIKSLPAEFHIPDYLYYAGMIAAREKRYSDTRRLLKSFVGEHKSAKYCYTPAMHEYTLQNALKTLVKTSIAQLNLPELIYALHQTENSFKMLKAVFHDFRCYIKIR